MPPRSRRPPAAPPWPEAPSTVLIPESRQRCSRPSVSTPGSASEGPSRRPSTSASASRLGLGILRRPPASASASASLSLSSAFALASRPHESSQKKTNSRLSLSWLLSVTFSLSPLLPHSCQFMGNNGNTWTLRRLRGILPAPVSARPWEVPAPTSSVGLGHSARPRPFHSALAFRVGLGLPFTTSHSREGKIQETNFRMSLPRLLPITFSLSSFLLFPPEFLPL